MPNRKPLSITSPDHAIALSFYFILGWSGILFVVGQNTSSGVYRALGPDMIDVWGTAVGISGFGAFLSAVWARRSPRPEHNLWVEMWFCWGLTGALGYYVVALAVQFGQVAQSSLVFSSIFAIGTLFRAIQIIREQRILKKARLNPRESDPVLADPRENLQ